MDSHKSQDTIAEWSGFLVSASTRPYMFLCLTLKQANDVFFFLILSCSLYTVMFGFDASDDLSLVSHFHLWTTSMLEETDHLSFVSSTKKSSSFQLSSSTTSQNIILTVLRRPEIFVPFLSSLEAGSPWNNGHARCSCSNTCPSTVLLCNPFWAVLGGYVCNNYQLALYTVLPPCPWDFPLYLVEAILYHFLSNFA